MYPADYAGRDSTALPLITVHRPPLFRDNFYYHVNKMIIQLSNTLKHYIYFPKFHFVVDHLFFTKAYSP